MSFRVRVAARLAALAMVSAGVAGCSTGAARFGDNPFNNTPVARGNTPAQEVTGAIPPAGSAPIARVERKPLGQQATASSLPPPPQVYRQASLPPQPTYQAPAPARSAPPPARAAAPAAAPHLTSTNGVHVVASGDTLITIARRYGKSRAEVARANNLPIDAKMRIGQRVSIPGSAGGLKSASAGRVLGAPPAPLAVPKHTPAPKLAAKQEVSKPATRTAALAPAHQAPVKKTEAAPTKAAIVPSAPASKKSVAEAHPAPKPATASKAATAPEPQKLAKAEPVGTAHLATPANDAKTEAAEAAPSTTGSIPGFRWPVRGRVIAGFGPKSNGQQNDGINLAVPEGTSVKAAEDGVVAYSGNELKGYGNLVLVRHSNGYVTAYAHASQLLVKRGDTIKRGQIIAKAGQTGSVASPQLHFEIRKGSTPVEPTQFLTGG